MLQIIAARSENFVAHLPLNFKADGTIHHAEFGTCGIFDNSQELSEESIILDDNICEAYAIPPDCFLFLAAIAV